MVFPHAVAPEQTFALLATYGFSGTANSSNIPMGAQQPHDLDSLLRPSTTEYGGLLSLLRYSVSDVIPRPELAIQMFLGSPLLFYSHENLFENGSQAFDSYADFLNQNDPKVKWANLGEIARHSHLLRQRSDGNFDVLRLASDFRDIHLSRSKLGSAVIRGYYSHRWDKAELFLEDKRWWLITALVAILFVVRMRKRKRSSVIRESRIGVQSL